MYLHLKPTLRPNNGTSPKLFSPRGKEIDAGPLGLKLGLKFIFFSFFLLLCACIDGKEAAPDLHFCWEDSLPSFYIEGENTSDKILFKVDQANSQEPPLCQEIIDYSNKIELGEQIYDQMFPHLVYFFKFKVKTGDSWSEWSSPFPFESPSYKKANDSSSLYEIYPHISKELLKKVEPYLLPAGHPAKEKLDQIFSSSRVLLGIESMKKAGFIKPYPRKFTRLVVTSHPDLKGFIIKAYLDAQRYHKDKPEYYYWISRINGAKAILKKIEEWNLGHLFKVPKKWVYILPSEPSPPKEHIRKNFILIEEDMGLLSDHENRKMWKSDQVTPELLDKIFQMLEEIGLHDCAKPDNIPFSKDGRIAFIDTQSHHEWPVNYKKLTPFLSSKVKGYWKNKIKQASK